MRKVLNNSREVLFIKPRKLFLEDGADQFRAQPCGSCWNPPCAAFSCDKSLMLKFCRGSGRVFVVDFAVILHLKVLVWLLFNIHNKPERWHKLTTTLRRSKLLPDACFHVGFYGGCCGRFFWQIFWQISWQIFRRICLETFPKASQTCKTKDLLDFSKKIPKNSCTNSPCL